MLMPSRSAHTAIAPRMRQYEQVQRRAEPSPSVSLAVNRTPPQWQAPLIGSMAAFIHGSLFGNPMDDYTLSSPPPRRMRASVLLPANDRSRETRTPAMESRTAVPADEAVAGPLRSLTRASRALRSCHSCIGAGLAAHS